MKTHLIVTTTLEGDLVFQGRICQADFLACKNLPDIAKVPLSMQRASHNSKTWAAEQMKVLAAIMMACQKSVGLQWPYTAL